MDIDTPNEVLAKAIRPEWFGALFKDYDGTPVHCFDNYPRQHEKYQSAARNHAGILIKALDDAGYEIRKKENK